MSYTTYEQCKEEIINFRNQNRNDCRDESYFKWRYLERPNDLQSIIIMARNEKDKLIGAISIIPHHFSVNNDVKHIGMIGDISVSKDFRRRGIAKRMFDFINEIKEVRDFEFLIVLPNYEASIPLLRAGWIKASSLYRYVNIIDADYYLKDRIKIKLLRSLIANIIKRVISYSYHDNYISNEYAYKVSDKLDDDFDKFWDSIDKKKLILGCRNKSYLDWRYFKHPLIKYDIFTIYMNSVLSGYIIFHVTEQDNIIIDDLMCLNFDSDYNNLLQSFIKYIRELRIGHLIYFRVNDNIIIKPQLNKHGFIKRNDTQDVLVYILGKNDGLINNIDNAWFITSGDKDT